METLSRPMSTLDFSHLRPIGNAFWRTDRHFLRLIPTATATKSRFLNTLEAYQKSQIDITLLQAPNQLWYLAEPCGLIPLSALYLELDFELRTFIWRAITERILQYHKAQLSYGFCEHPQISLGLNGQVYLHGCHLEKNVRRLDEVKHFSQFLSRLLTQPCPSITLKQQNLLAASSLMVALNEGCAGNLKANDGIKTILQSIDLLLVSTPETLQRRLAHALFNKNIRQPSNRLSLQLEQAIRQRKYPKDSPPDAKMARPKIILEPPVPQVKAPPTAPLAKPNPPKTTVSAVSPKPKQVVQPVPPLKGKTTTPTPVPKPQDGPQRTQTASIRPPVEPPPPSKRVKPLPLVLASAAALSIIAILLFGQTKKDVQKPTISSQSPPLTETNLTPSTAETAPQDTPMPSPTAVEPSIAPQAIQTADKTPAAAQTAASTNTARSVSSRKTGPRKSRKPPSKEARSESTRPVKTPDATPAVQIPPNDPDIEPTQPTLTLSQKRAPSPFESVVDPWQQKAKTGQLDAQDIIFLRTATLTDPYFTSTQTLILMNAQAQDNSMHIKMALEALLMIDENQTDPYICLAAAHHALHNSDYRTTLDFLNAAQADRWPEENWAYEGQWHEIKAAAITGLYLTQDPNIGFEMVTNAWNRAYAIALQHQQADRLMRIQKQLVLLDAGDP